MLCTLDPTVVVFPHISFLVFPASTFRVLHAIYSMFPHKNSVCSSLLPHTYYMPHPSHPPCVNQHVNIWWTIWTVKLLFMEFSQGCCSSFLLCPNISLFTWFSNTCLSLNVNGDIPVMFVSVFPLPRSLDLGLQMLTIICVIKKLISWFSNSWQVGPYDLGMVQPQVADGVTASNIEGRCKCIE